METVKAQLDLPILRYAGWQTAHLKSEQNVVGPFPWGTFVTWWTRDLEHEAHSSVLVLRCQMLGVAHSWTPEKVEINKGGWRKGASRTRSKDCWCSAPLSKCTVSSEEKAGP